MCISSYPCMVCTGKDHFYAYDEELEQFEGGPRWRSSSATGLGNERISSGTPPWIRERTILQLKVDDAILERYLTTLMGEKVEPRREFIEAMLPKQQPGYSTRGVSG